MSEVLHDKRRGPRSRKTDQSATGIGVGCDADDPACSRLLPFWMGLALHGERPALIDATTSRIWSYRALDNDVTDGAKALGSADKQLILLCAETSASFLLVYLSALRAGHAVLLCGQGPADAATETLVGTYAPDQVLWSGAAPGTWARAYAASADVHGYRRVRRSRKSQAPLHPDMTLVMPTSGSTGGPRAVRLSARNLAVNAHQIRLDLGVDEDARVITTLPFSYIFGLSIVHSHLAAGGALVISDQSVLRPGFWKHAHDWAATSLAGVTFTFELLRRVDVQDRAPASLRHLAHSGGRLPPVLSDWIRQDLTARFDVHLMYGMTEGAGRLCILPPRLLPTKPSSVGFPVRWGRVTVDEAGEVIFTGPNVMMGYAASRDDLARGDDLAGTLRTGDLGRLDDDGCLHLTGRSSRFCKFFGRRFSLDDIEGRFADLGEVAAVADARGVLLVHGRDEDGAAIAARAAALTLEFDLPPGALRLALCEVLPRTTGGKIAYATLAGQLEPEKASTRLPYSD